MALQIMKEIAIDNGRIFTDEDENFYEKFKSNIARNLKIPIIKFINDLNEYGKVLIVGGFVRDSFYGLDAKDLDLVTDIEFD